MSRVHKRNLGCQCKLRSDAAECGIWSQVYYVYIKCNISSVKHEEQGPLKWAASSKFGTFRLCKQRRFRRACASAHSCQNLRCSLIQAVSQEKPSDRKPDPSEFMSSSIPSWQIVTAHAQTFKGARDLAFCLKVPLDSLLVWVSSGGSGETAWMCRLAWTFAACIGDKYQIRLTWPNCVSPCETLFLPYANNKGADPRSLISTFIVRCRDSIISLVSISEITSL